MSPARLLIARLLISLTFVTGATSAHAASFLDPAHRYRTLTTEHFSIHFHQGEDRLARRLAVIAEDVWRKLRGTLGAQPPSHTEVVLADQTDLANGFAAPVPYNTIMVSAVWPAGSDLIGNTDDWLRLVFTHEFTHIVHLDRSEGWARVVRAIFGRTLVAFPNVFLPGWQIEGLATYEESRLPGEGRLHAGDFRSIVDEAARAGRFEPLGRLNGALTDWPGGGAAYAYGAGFHEYLAEQYGDASFARLADATARRVPFTASRVFARVYGRSLGDLWRDYEASVTSRVAGLAEARKQPERAKAEGPALPDTVEPRRLTHHGFVVAGPRFDRSACDSCSAPVIYSVRTPHEFPALYELPGDRGTPRKLGRRYLGSTSGVSKETIVFDQQELRRNTGLYSDLYALDRATGRVRPLTVEARLLDPDLAPDGSTLVAVQDAPGRRDLVRVEGALEGRPVVTVLASEPDTQFNAPRWSPDGRRVAVERHRRGRPSEIAIVDVETRAARTIASDARARFVTPAWRPDGLAVLAAADWNGDPRGRADRTGSFNLYEIGVDRSPASEWRPLTQGSAGATWPDVSADGKSIVFVGYTADGFDLFEMPYPDAAARPSITPELKSAAAPDETGDQPADVPSVAAPSYNPLRTLRPTSWSPILESDRRQVRMGLATGGMDVLRYHAYTGSATWRASAPSGTATLPAGMPDWQVSYSYDRWQPTVWLSASAQTSFSAGPAAADGTPVTATLRERQFEAGLVFPVRHIRFSHRTVTALVRGVDELTLPAGLVTSNRTAWRGGWSIDSSHRYGYSISPEDGGTFGVTADVSRAAFGSSADTTAITADGRLYMSPFARHQVLAVRLAGGVSTGDPTVRKTFHLGGAQPNAATLDFGRGAISLLRGFGTDTFAGSHVALMNVDYRWPVVRLQRGHGTWPLALHTAHAAVFADAGHAWTRGFRARDVKTSFGGELSLDMIVGYSSLFTLTAGAAWGRDGSRTVANGGVAYVRVGRAF